MTRTVLVTGAAGFIGAALSMRLLQRGDRVVGLDNLNDYYDPSLKQARLRQIETKSPAGGCCACELSGEDGDDRISSVSLSQMEMGTHKR